MDQFSVAATEAARALGGFTLKTEQMEVVTSILRGRDVFAQLPTGYGKTLCYAVLPVAFDLLQPGCKSIVVVLSPLTAIMKDQVSVIMTRKNIFSEYDVKILRNVFIPLVRIDVADAT